MTLINFEPTRELENIHSNLMRYFDDFPTFRRFNEDSFSPRVDISEKEDKIDIIAEIPGVDKKDIKLTMEDNTLTIEGEKKNEMVNEDKNYYRSERRYGAFKRCFTLPQDIDTHKIDAKFENGVLKVTFKKENVKKQKDRVIKLK